MKKQRGMCGPKTLAGKQRSRSNACKHGLAALRLIQDCSLREEQLTNIFCNGQVDSAVQHVARTAAVARMQLEEVMTARASVLRLCIASNAAADKTPEVYNAEGVMGSLESLKSLARYERRALTRWFRCLDAMQNAKAERGYNYKL